MRRNASADDGFEFGARREVTHVSLLAHGSGRPYRVSLSGAVERELLDLLVASGRFSLAAANPRGTALRQMGSAHSMAN